MLEATVEPNQIKKQKKKKKKKNIKNRKHPVDRE